MSGLQVKWKSSANAPLSVPPILGHRKVPIDAATGKLASSLWHLNEITCHEAYRDGTSRVFSNWKGHRDRQRFWELRDALRAFLCPRIFDNAHHLEKGHRPSIFSIGEYCLCARLNPRHFPAFRNNGSPQLDRRRSTCLFASGQVAMPPQASSRDRFLSTFATRGNA